MSTAPVLQVQELSLRFPTAQGPLTVVDTLSFELHEGKTSCLVGESGCGKSMVALSLMRLVPPPGQIVEGRILFESQDLLELTEHELRQLRGNSISIIFQEPMTALNPVYPIGPQVAEVIRNHQGLSRREAAGKAREIMSTVGLPARDRFMDYPHELSGGMRQRVLIAIALACHPEVLIADEPTTALDVTIQAQILDLLARIQADLGMTVLFVTHDLSVVAEIADEVMVMYAGQLVEQAPVAALFEEPAHPYTQALLRAIPRPTGQAGRRLQTIAGQVPRSVPPPSGCLFADRCPSAFARCRLERPTLLALAANHEARCFLVER